LEPWRSSWPPGLFIPRVALAQAPSRLFAYLYGRVAVDGECRAGDAARLAFVGKSCEVRPRNFVTTEGDDIPPEDIGKTVYVVDVLADGHNVYEREGCAHPGDPILLYLPAIGRMSSTQPLFQPGPVRADLQLDIWLGYRQVVPAVASEGAD
jgi:hypothetical protein